MNQKHDARDVAALVGRAQDGDHTAMTELYDRFAPDLFRYALAIVRSEDVAEDVVSEAFMRAWTHLPSFRGDNFRAYLYAIARNYAYDTMRKSTRETPLASEPVDQSADTDLLQRAISSEKARELMAALYTLPDQQREVLTLRFMEALSVRETAEVMQISEIAVRVTQYRAVKKLQSLLS